MRKLIDALYIIFIVWYFLDIIITADMGNTFLFFDHILFLPLVVTGLYVMLSLIVKNNSK